MMLHYDSTSSSGEHPLLGEFPVIVEAEVRWGEMDTFGHVNNIYFFRYFEIARIAYFDAIGFREGGRTGPILAHATCRFRKPLRYPDHLRIGARVTDVQEDRFLHEYAIVSQRLDTVAASGEGVIVSYDYELGARAPLPQEIVHRIAALESG